LQLTCQPICWSSAGLRPPYSCAAQAQTAAAVKVRFQKHAHKVPWQRAMLNSAASEDQSSGFERSGSGTCKECGSISYSRQWEAAFGVRLCNECGANYSLISKVVSAFGILLSLTDQWSAKSSKAAQYAESATSIGSETLAFPSAGQCEAEICGDRRRHQRAGDAGEAQSAVQGRCAYAAVAGVPGQDSTAATNAAACRQRPRTDKLLQTSSAIIERLCTRFMGLTRMAQT